MISQHLIERLEENGIAQNDIDTLNNFEPRDGFEFLSEHEQFGMEEYINSYADEYGLLIPILTDNNSNFICVTNNGYVCYLSHDEINLTPLFKNIANLINSVKQNPEAWDIQEMPASAFDFDDLPF
ncbi:MAG: hypothetical protein DI598_16655 [Pseudopedobacter saltans]|uniref:SMI1/KNR4 family protein n=1 Tax=Pseudopedobacter saltans TaxID=151895 RepID=A0A2W5GAU8_9SPHI|nr:MAG: hypothetical protein DI598_16655 [Pseudopedobacter saltans]